MIDFEVLSDNTFFITNSHDTRQFHSLKATVDGIQINVHGSGEEVEKINSSDIRYIVMENKSESFLVADSFIQFLKSDLTDKPVLFDFLLALCNGDIIRADTIANNNAGLSDIVLTYMQGIAKMKNFNAQLSFVFINYMRYRNKKAE